jgi:hypothetical protein
MKLKREGEFEERERSSGRGEDGAGMISGMDGWTDQISL